MLTPLPQLPPPRSKNSRLNKESNTWQKDTASGAAYKAIWHENALKTPNVELGIQVQLVLQSHLTQPIPRHPHLPYLAPQPLQPLPPPLHTSRSQLKSALLI